MTLVECAVRSRTANRTSISQPADFVVDAGTPVPPARMLEPDVSPYCFDFDRRELLCVSTPDISEATFFYQAQRELARSVVRVPLDALPEPERSPALIFSIGRCGSTLLHKALRAAGVAAVSEPDYFTQAALRPRADAALPEHVARASALLRYAVVKLRAECCNAPLVVAGGFRAPRIVFVLRDAERWAESVRRVSRDPAPAAVAALLRTLVGGLETLAARYEVRICYYEEFRQLTAHYVNGLLAWIGCGGRLRPAAASEIARKDAQEGSVVSRDAVAGARSDPAFGDAFRREWRAVRPAALIERLGLRGI